MSRPESVEAPKGRAVASRNVVTGYLLATPLFALLDFGLGVPLRVAGLDDPTHRGMYYAAVFGLGLVARTYPTTGPWIGIFESAGNILLLILAVMLPIWDLPAFIDQLETAGFSARRYAVWFQMELAQPLFLIALVLVGAAFTMKHARLANTGTSVLAAVMLGFTLHYIRNFAQVLGENGQIPILLAAWAPPVASLLLALGILLHMEDG